MSEDKLHFIVIDDSKLDCFIADKIIQKTGRSAFVQTFQQATQALDVITAAGAPDGALTIVFVDIQMPLMNGFEFVEAFEALPEDVKAGYHLYMLSSSINENDIAKVRSYPSVKTFLNKPLTNDSIQQVLAEY